MIVRNVTGKSIAITGSGVPKGTILVRPGEDIDISAIGLEPRHTTASDRALYAIAKGVPPERSVLGYTLGSAPKEAAMCGKCKNNIYQCTCGT